jgi:phage-related protein
MLISNDGLWTIAYYNERLRHRILEMPEDIVAEYLRFLNAMEKFGPDLGMPHSKSMGKKLFELRPSGASGIGRVFYCTLSQGRIVMLHSFIKKTQRTPLKELYIARKRMKEVQRNA